MYAEEYINLGVTLKDGATRREHMISAGYEEDQLIDSEMPILVSHIFDYYRNLSATRKSNGFAIMPIDYEQMNAYFCLTNEAPEKWEIDAIRYIDSIALRIYSEKK